MPRTAATVSAVLGFLILLLTFSALASAGEVHLFESSFGSPGSGDGELSLQLPESNVEPKVPGSGLAVDDATHDVYVADTDNRRVDEFTSAGAFIRAFGADVGGPGIDVCTTSCGTGTKTSDPGGFEEPIFVAVDNSAGASEGDVYVADTAADLVSKFDPEGNLITSWASGGQLDGAGAEHGPFISISGITVDPAGRLFVYDGNQEQWFEFSQSGAAEPTVPVGRATVPSGIAVDSLGHLYKVVGFKNLEQYSAAGTDLGFVDNPFPAEPDTTGFAIDLSTDSIYLDQAGTEIEHFGPACASGSNFPCAVEDRFGSAQLSGGGAGVAVDASDGTVYVADAAGSRIDVYAAAQSADVATDPATAIEPATATLNGHLDPAGGGEVSECLFEWGTTTAYGETHPCAEGQAFSAPAAVHTDLTDLQPDTTYHFRLRAANTVVATEGADQVLTTTGPPIVTEEQATDIEPTTATLGATINPSGHRTEYRFEYGTSASYGSQTPFTPLAAEGHADEAVGAPISGLQRATVYHFRAVARSECEPLADPGHVCIVEGPDETFESLPAVSVRDLTTQTVAPELVTLKAELDPNNGGTTHYEFCLGSQAGSYGIGCVEGTLKGVAGEFEEATATFTGLIPDTTYYYRLTAGNSGGPIETADQSFTTELSAAEERAAESCPNSLLREENNSLALPDCRAYEQVSPAFKSGYAIGGGSVGEFHIELSPSGEGAAFESLGAFEGASATAATNHYSAQRVSNGWLTQSNLGFPAGPDEQPNGFYGYSPEFDSWLFSVRPGTSFEPAERSGTVSLFIGSSAHAFDRASPSLSMQAGERPHGALFAPVGESSDLSKIALATGYRFLPPAVDPRPSAENAGSDDRVYEFSSDSGSDPTASLVAEVPIDLTAPGSSCVVDAAVGRPGRWMSTDGSVLFYTAPQDLTPRAACDAGGAQGGGPNKAGVYARVGQASPVLLSGEDSSECHAPNPCHGAAPQMARYDGASPDGSRAWFTTPQPLIDSDTDATDDLYLAELEEGQLKHLVQASAGESSPDHPVAGDGAGVEGVVEVSPDGTHVAFVATGILTEAGNPATHQIAAQGADNLYVYDATTDHTKFVARLCTGLDRSDSSADPYCSAEDATDAPLWRAGTLPEARFTPDGRYLLFTSYGRLTSDDTDNSADVYRYDFQSGHLIRISAGHAGNDGNGNDSAFAAQLTPVPREVASRADGLSEDDDRAISADGSTVVFETAAPLVSRDTNAGASPGCNPGRTGCDIYEWREDGNGTCREAGGCISLISDGISPQGATQGVVSSSGRDIAFLTAAELVPVDSDGLRDLYDARENGGFPYVPPEKSCGSGETCLGPVSPTPSPPKITTPEFTGPGNEKAQLQCGKGRHRIKKHGEFRCVAKKHHKKNSHHKKKHAKAEKHHQRASHNRGGRK
jgi:DNA-binding beta-propeller fold protein YncE